MQNEIIKLQHIHKQFGDHVIFKDFNEQIYENELIAITGASGKGKTTLINMIGGLDEVDAGNILINQTLMNKKNRLKLYRYDIAFLFQNFALVDEWTVEQNLNIALKYRKAKIKENERQTILSMLKIEDKLKNKVYTLSGGEQQRVALARIMFQDHKIILADEPTGSLDEVNRDIVFNILQGMKKQGKTIIMVTHDMELAQKCDRVINL